MAGQSANIWRFKPQRGKFTLQSMREFLEDERSFKPQRGKFTPTSFWDLSSLQGLVSNPNGVNLHIRGR